MPTFADPAVSRQLDRSDQHAYFWRALDAFIRLATMAMNFVSAIGMLLWFCWRHPVAAPLAAASAFSTLFMTVSHIRGETFRSGLSLERPLNRPLMTGLDSLGCDKQGSEICTAARLPGHGTVEGPQTGGLGLQPRAASRAE